MQKKKKLFVQQLQNLEYEIFLPEENSMVNFIG